MNMKTFLAPLARERGTKPSRQSFRPIQKTERINSLGNTIRFPLFLAGLWSVLFLHIGFAQSQEIQPGNENVSCRFFLNGHKLNSGEAQLPESTQNLLVQVLVALNEKWKAIFDLGIDYKAQINQLKSRNPEVFFELALLETFGKITKEVNDIEKNEHEVRNMEAGILALIGAQGSDEKVNTLQLISMFRDESNAWVSSVRRYWDSILDRLIHLEDIWRPEINRNSAFIEISMKDANSDLFVQLLKQMYLRYAEKRKWKTEIISTSESIHSSTSSRSSQGISSIVIKVEGPGVFRALEWESGIHRLMAALGELRGATVKKGNEEKITTVNVLVTVLPGPSASADSIADIGRFTDEDFLIEALKKSRGPGGQHVNKTESAVRVTHIRTGIQVVISSHRSQHHNREEALQIVRAKVKQKQEEQKERARQQRRSDVAKMENTGSAVPFVRSYKKKLGLVIDTRMASTVEPQSIDDVLDGNLDPFVSGGRYLAIDRILKELLDRISNQVEKAEKRCRSFGGDSCG